MKYLADVLTFSRILMSIFLIVWGIVGGNVDVFCVVFAIAELTDSFDGYCSRKWPFKNPPAYRKFAVGIDIFADMLLWFSAMLFFILRINLAVGLSVAIAVAVIAGLIEIIVYRRFFGHPDNFAKGSLCDRNFTKDKKVIMLYELTFVKTLGHNGICPNCGAKLPKTNVCDYCHSVVPNSGSDWVLAKKQTLQQK